MRAPSRFLDSALYWHVNGQIDDSTNESSMLTLTDAIKTRKLHEFIAQEEARGVAPVKSSDLEKAIKLLATTPQQPEDQTSRSSSDDD